MNKKQNNHNEHQGLDNALDFSCEYSDNVPHILQRLNISLAFTSYQAGRLMLVRSDGSSLDINFKHFHRPMGLVASEQGLTLGTFTEVINFHREEALLDKIKLPHSQISEDITAPRLQVASASTHDKKNDDKNKLDLTDKAMWQAYQKKLFAPVDSRVDACFISRSVHYTGMINIHDIDWGDEGLWVVNSSFSCLCTLAPDFSFVPQWKPPFISELLPEDRCHLNGMALKNGKPAYATSFSQNNEVAQWRKGEKFSGTLMDVQANEVVIDGLAMPHSPRCHQDKVYFCNSGFGEVCRYYPDTKTKQVIASLPGFTRGMDFYGPLMFVGLSKVRATEVEHPAPLLAKNQTTYSGIWLIDLENNQVVGYIKFKGNVDQIYDVTVINQCHFPELIEPDHPRMRNHFSHPPL